MRLAFYAPLKPASHPVPSGDRRMARLLIQAWEKAGHSVEVASRLRTHDGAGEPARQADLAAIGEAQAARLMRNYAERPPAERPAAWFTYHVYYKAPDWIGPKIAKALGIPYLIAEASLAGKRAQGPYALGHRGAQAAIRAANVIFTINPTDAEALQQIVGGQTRLVDLPAFVDTLAYRRMPEQRDCLRRDIADRHNLETGHPWLLAVAMMRSGDKLASYRMLGEALGQVLDLDWQLIVVGDGAAREEVIRALAPLGGERVRFVGAQSETRLPAYYGAADLCVWPAVNEAYGMALLEAQAAGLPVVAGGAGGVPSIVESGITGLLTAPGDGSAFARALRNLIEAPDRRVAMARTAVEKTRQLHDIAVAAQILDRALHQALLATMPGA
jgi:glycosyltransferase involved in cell wall biosynthesis